MRHDMTRMGLERGTNVKREHTNAIRTNEMFFDECKSSIKLVAWTDPREIGEGAKTGFSQETSRILLIKGHTDNKRTGSL